MNIAAGEPLERGKYLGDFTPKDFVTRLMKEKFDGYVCITVQGRRGLEEGLMVFHDGEIVASDYEYYKFNHRVKAEDGLKRTLNAMLAKNGVVDSFSLTPYQIQLILTLNEDCALKEKTDEKSLLIPSSFSFKYEQELVKETAEEDLTRESLLKRLGLTRLRPPSATRTQLMTSAKEEHEHVKKMMEEKGK